MNQSTSLKAAACKHCVANATDNDSNVLYGIFRIDSCD